MNKTVIVGVDNSDTALRAAEKAASLARAYDGELHVVSAFSEKFLESFRSMQKEQDCANRGDSYKRLIEQYRDNANSIASTVAEAIRLGFPELQVFSRSAEGVPAAALLREADRIEADIIVVGNKGVQGPTRILGSIARTVASEAQCDLYVANTL